jgi:hypothetical protein
VGRVVQAVENQPSKWEAFSWNPVPPKTLTTNLSEANSHRPLAYLWPMTNTVMWTGPVDKIRESSYFHALKEFISTLRKKCILQSFEESVIKN